jgi:translation initiation factor 2 subunit 1
LSEKEITSLRALPEVGELVIATITKIMDYGAYATLDEYENTEGLLHISEISSTWVKNIRDHVREKQKVVLKVLRVDAEKRHIDLSLRRVSGKERQDKLLQWKRRRRVESILENAAEKLKIDPKNFCNEVIGKLEEKYNDAYIGIEEMIEKGEEIIERLKIPSEWAIAIIDVAKQKVKLPTVKIKGNLELTCAKPDGIDVIKKILIDLKNLKRSKKVKVNVYAIGAPRYAVEITAKNYKDAEKTLQEIIDYALQEIKEAGGVGNFKRSD